jgi:hypothetical protein
MMDHVVMLFELCNIVATFTTMMNMTFRTEMDNFVVEYIDDILIFSKPLEGHTKHIEQVLSKLQERKL